MTTLTPDRTLQQRLDALERANQIRHERSQLKRDLKHGRVALVPTLTEPPEFLLTAAVLDVLLAAPKIGRVKANKALNRARISPSKTVGGLTDRQRAELVAAMVRR